MLSFKRVLIATIMCLICGFICMGLATSDPESCETLITGIILSIILSRTLTGFMIGISALRMAWWIHGIILGFIGSIPMALPMLDDPGIFIGTFVMGIIYGFLIELVTSVLFKAKPVGWQNNGGGIMGTE